ncbi:serine/threonine-protein kinase [Legionella busanensis]|uniref:Serine/threonine-protein kinase n=1 Tax=Legionella busanensis TaxID=190655 RepID=A0A378JPW5_9GAMM|nr:protein kinase [Legionella busanensis]STX52313.1 serine/threonine-protein kinase [Legionella busanensis]
MKNLSKLQTKNLINFFASQTRTNVWKKNQIYTLADNTSILFNYDVVRRKCKDGQDVRYEFISPHLLNSGSVGKIFDVLATLAIKKDKIHFKQYGYNGKSRVVKIQQHDEDHPPLSAMKEYRLTKQANHLAMKEPVFDNTNTSYTIMEKLKGCELFDVIFDDLKRKRILTLNERVELTYALLKALKLQVTDKNIIHRDIKPENIFVDLNRPIKVTIFDYGLSTFVNYNDHKLVGTPGYIPPEIFERGEQTPALDIFSMGQVIALLWHANTGLFTESPLDNMYEVYEQSKHADLSGLYQGINGLDRSTQMIIRDMLKYMLEAESHNRISITAALNLFTPIYHKYLLPPEPVRLKLDAKVNSAKAQFAKITAKLAELDSYSQNLNLQSKPKEAIKLNNLSQQIKLKLTKLQKSDYDTFADKLDNYLKEILHKITHLQIHYANYKDIVQSLSNLFTMLNEVHAYFGKPVHTNPMANNKALFFNRPHVTSSRLNEKYSLPAQIKVTNCKVLHQIEQVANPSTEASIQLPVC